MQNLDIKESNLRIKPQIQFLSGVEEITVPRRVKLTRSENGETGTATFLFFEPTVFSIFLNVTSSSIILIKGMDLIWDKKKNYKQRYKDLLQRRKTRCYTGYFYLSKFERLV